VQERCHRFTGSIDASPQWGGLYRLQASCDIHHLPHEVLDQASSRRVFRLCLPKGIWRCINPDGGFLLSERCIVAHVMAAQELGQKVHGQEHVMGGKSKAKAWRCTPDRGSYSAAKNWSSAAGAGGRGSSPNWPLLRYQRRQVLGWFQPMRPALFRVHSLPVFTWRWRKAVIMGSDLWHPRLQWEYHHLEQRVDPDQMDRQAHREDEDVLRRSRPRFSPMPRGPTMSLKTCLFTNTPDEHFILDLHPQHCTGPVSPPGFRHG